VAVFTRDHVVDDKDHAPRPFPEMLHGALVCVLVWLTRGVVGWKIPNIDKPTYTYQCMPMEITWRDGSPPYSVWLSRGQMDNRAPVAGLGAWHNLTGHNYLVPCAAPAGKHHDTRLAFLAQPRSRSRSDAGAQGLDGLDIYLECVFWVDRAFGR
jgi:hypothetical protein